MAHRKARLGDVIDDRCTRCRLLLNHGVVSIVEGKIKKVRCLTCQFEHPYRQGRSGRSMDRKKRDMKKLYDKVLRTKDSHVRSNELSHKPPVSGRKVRIARPEEPDENHTKRRQDSDPPAASLPPPPKGKGKVASWRQAWEELQKKKQD